MEDTRHTRIIEVDREGMQTLEKLADATMKVSEAQNDLQDLKTEETEYLAEREGRAVASIMKVVEDSEEVLRQAETNYDAATAIAGTASSLSDRVKDVIGRVKSIMSAFDERSRLWEAKVKVQEERLAEAKRAGILQKGSLDTQRQSQDKRAAELIDWEEDLASREEALKRDIESLKN